MKTFNSRPLITDSQAASILYIYLGVKVEKNVKNMTLSA